MSSIDVILWLLTQYKLLLHLVCTCVLTDRKKYSRIRGIYICYNNEHNHHEGKLPEIQKESHLHRVCYIWVIASSTGG
jgi:hypothetical protein